MAKAALSPLALSVVQEDEESTGNDAFIQTPGQTPTAKRQRRLTLTAMTGLICELAQDSSSENAPAPQASREQEVIESASVPPLPTLSQHKVMVEVRSSVPLQRESSPVRRVKRARASISATATVEVMAAQAARTLTASGSNSCGRSRAVGHASESSDSTEEEEDSLALRVRRSQAFECGAQAVSDASANAETQSEWLYNRERGLSPGSKIAFSQGVRAAQVAAKVAAKMASQSSEPVAARRNAVPAVPSLTLRMRGGA